MNLPKIHVHVCLLFLSSLPLVTMKLSTKEVFEQYYKCITTKNEAHGKTKDLAEAKMLMEGQDIEMSCRLCFRPDQDIESYNVRWKRMLLMSAGESVVPIDDDKFTLTPDKTLIIRGMTVDDAGQYLCLKGDEIESLYQVDVVRKEKRVQITENGERKPRPEKVMDKNNLIVFTTWSEWSVCNRCNKPGHRRKIGICTVKKQNMADTVLPFDVPFMTDYPKGIPCRSTLIPKFLEKLPEIGKRPSETLLGTCEVTCPTLPPFKEITDKTGKVVERVRSGEGFLSLREGRPTLPPLVKRKTIYEDINKSIVIECPHKTAANTMVRWQNGTDIINPMKVRKKTRGRVKIDSSNKLHIRRLRTWDTQPYSCWIDGKHIATIKIKVVEKTEIDTKEYVVYAGIGTTLLAICCVGGKICRKSRSKTAR